MEKELISLVAATLFKTWDGNGDFSKIRERNKKPWLDSAKAIVDYSRLQEFQLSSNP